MRLRKFILSFLFILSSGYAIAQQPQPEQRNQLDPLAMDPKLHYGILPNGLTYYIRHNERPKDRADFYIIQDVGAILEEDNQNGLAHFLEHMAFQGTKNFPDKLIINYLESIGVKFGANINAYTSLDETVYNLKSVPTTRSSIVDSALLVLHDWSSFLTLDSEEIDKERGVIVEEWRTRNKANRRMWKASLPILFRNSQYAKRDVIGDTAIIKHFAYDTLRAYYHKWYRPDLQAIVIVGDIDPDTVESKVKRMFADIPKRINPAPRPVYTIEDNKEPIVAIITDPEAQYNRLNIDYRHNPVPDRFKASEQGYYYSTVEKLTEKMLNERFGEISQEANSPFAQFVAGKGELVKSKDAFSLYCVPNTGKETEAFDRMIAEGERARRFGFSQSELDRAKADMLSAFEKAYNEREKNTNNSFVEEYKRNFLDFEPVPGIEWEYMAIQRMLPAITIDDVNTVLRRNFFAKENITVEIMGTESLNSLFTENTVIQKLNNAQNLQLNPYIDKVVEKPLVKKTPKAGKIKKIERNEALDYTQWTLSNGMKVVLKPTQHKKDEVLLYAFCNGGISLEGDVNKIPSAQFSADIVESNGIGDFDASALRKALAGKMVSISPSISSYEHSLSGSSSVKDAETLLQLFHLYFTAVRADDNGYNSLINQYKTILENKSTDPNKAFNDSVNVTVNGHNKRTVPFDTRQLAKVNQKDALDFFKRCFSNPADFTVVLTGNIDEIAMRNSILTYLGGLKQQKEKTTWTDRGIRTPKGVVRTQFNKKTQTKKAINFIYYTGGMKPSLCNRLNLQAASNVLGIRYLESMREKEGGTYGVSCSSSISDKPTDKAALQMVFETAPEAEEKLLPLIQQEIDTLLAFGPKATDLQKVKEILIKNHKERVKENSHWQAVIASYLKRGEDDETDYIKTVESITAESLTATLRELMKQGNKIEVIMMPEE